jgi:hypothetical protein
MESETGELAEAIKPVIDFDDHMVTNLDLPFIAATPSVVPFNTAKIAFTRREENCLLPSGFLTVVNYLPHNSHIPRRVEQSTFAS